MGWGYGSASLSHLPVPHCPGRLCPRWAFRMGHVRSPSPQPESEIIQFTMPPSHPCYLHRPTHSELASSPCSSQA